MKVLIVTNTRDDHAGPVSWALEKYGASVDRLIFSDYPQKLCISYSSEDSRFTLSGPSLSERSNWDVIWDRRPTFCSPHADLYSEDRRMAYYIGNFFLGSFKNDLAARGFWVNDWVKSVRGEDKLYQLQVAKRVGLRVPATLVSNDVTYVRAFVAAHERCIVKPILPMLWEADGRRESLYTSKITLSDLDDDIAIASCPMIYQEEIRKACEYRVLAIGDTLVTAKLDSQGAGAGALDYRLGYQSGLGVTPAELGGQTECMIRDFMSEAGLLMGAFDFALDERGGLVFFEVNPQGQFLWVENMNPEFKLLDTFAQFLMSCDPHFKLRQGGKNLSLADYHSSGEAARYARMIRTEHVQPLAHEAQVIFRDLLEPA